MTFKEYICDYDADTYPVSDIAMVKTWLLDYYDDKLTEIERDFKMFRGSCQKGEEWARDYDLEFIESVLRAIRELKIGEMEREQTTIRLPRELKSELEEEAGRIGIGLNAYILMILSEAENRQER
jgi:predicted HicB family RNase H-like nuclease